MSRPRTLLAVDLSYQTYRATSAHGLLKSQDDVFTGGLFGFMATVCKIILDSQADQCVVCEDVKPYRRTQVYPEYKLLRKASADTEIRDKYLTSVPLVKEMLATVGIPIMAYPGFEADDCIGHIVARHRHRYHTIYAASNDSDLYALFECPWFKVWRKDRADVMDYWRLKEETGLTPSEYSLATALTGTHNDIEGIARVGLKTASKAVLNPGLLRPLLERHGPMIERNKMLIKLPHAEFPLNAPVPKPLHSFDRHALYRWCAKYDINVTSRMVEAFEQVCP